MFYIAMIGVSWHFSGEMFFQGFSVHCFFFALKIIVRLWISPLHPGFSNMATEILSFSSTYIFNRAVFRCHVTLHSAILHGIPDWAWFWERKSPTAGGPGNFPSRTFSGGK